MTSLRRAGTRTQMMENAPTNCQKDLAVLSLTRRRGVLGTPRLEDELLTRAIALSQFNMHEANITIR